jgi:hypothetical protein
LASVAAKLQKQHRTKISLFIEIPLFLRAEGGEFRPI